MNTSTKRCNAWIYVGDDAPAGTNYNSPNSAYQRLITNQIYNSVDILFIAFVTTTPTGANTCPTGNGDAYTIEVAEGHPNIHPDGLSNAYYFDHVIADSKAVNPNIILSATLAWGSADILTNVFNNPNVPPGSTTEQIAEQFAKNLLVFLQHKGLNGFDIDWESPIGDSGINVDQFIALINAIGSLFKAQSEKYYLTLSPSLLGVICDQTGTEAGQAINENVDFLNLQLYGQQQISCPPGGAYTSLPDLFINAGVDRKLLAYGAEFESNNQTAENAYCGGEGRPGFLPDGYHVITQWRLNSNNFLFEQDNQVKLHQYVHSNQTCPINAGGLGSSTGQKGVVDQLGPNH